MKLLNIDGFNVLHIPHPSNLITVRVAIDAGSTDEKDSKDYGTAHYLEHLFFKGTKNKGFKELNAKMAGLGSGNASTNYAKTVYYINTIKPKLVETTDLLCEMMFEPAFDETEFNKERNVILEELQSGLDDPNDYFWRQSIEHVYGEQGHSIIGTKESVFNMKLKQLTDFRNINYTKDNLIFVVAGNIGEDEVEMAMTKALIRGKNCLEKKTCFKELNSINWEENQSKQFKHSAKQAFMQLYFHGPTLADKKIMNRSPSLFNNIFGGGLHSILGSRIREELGLCYSIYATDYGYDDLQAFIIGTQLNKENIDKAKDAIFEELAKVQKSGFSEDLIETSKSNLVYGMTKSGETSSGIASLFGDSFLEKIKVYDIEEMNIKYNIDKINSLTNDDLIKYANWIGEKGYKFVYMTGESEND